MLKALVDLYHPMNILVIPSTHIEIMLGPFLLSYLCSLVSFPAFGVEIIFTISSINHEEHVGLKTFLDQIRSKRGVKTLLQDTPCRDIVMIGSVVRNAVR